MSPEPRRSASGLGNLAGYVYGMIAIMTSLWIVTGIFAYWQVQRYLRVEQQTSRYHQPTILACDRMRRATHEMEAEWRSRTVGGPGAVPSVERQRVGVPDNTAAMLYVIERQLERVEQLQDGHHGADFAESVVRARTQFDAVTAAARDMRDPARAEPQEALQVAEAFAHTIDQVGLLHLAASADLHRDLREREVRAGRYLAVLLAGMFVGAVVLIRGLLRGMGNVIAERARAEAAVRDRERKLADAQELARVGNWEWDLSTGRMTGSPEFYRLFQLTPGEEGVSLDQVVEVMHPEDRAAVREGIEQVQAGQFVASLEYRVVWPTGEVRYIHGRMEQPEGDGGPPIVVGTVQDVTERTLAELELRERDSRLRAMLETSPLGIVACGRDGRVQFVNEHFVELVGAPSVEALVAEVNVLTHPHLMQGGLATFVGSCMREGRNIVTEVSYTTSFGEPAELRYHLAPWRDHGGQVVGCLGIVEDVAVSRQAELALAESQASLAKAQELAHIGNWEWDVPAGTVQVSAEVCRLFGVFPDDFAKTFDAFLGFVHPEERAVLRLAVDGALYEGTKVAIDHRVVRRDGLERWVHTQGEVQFDDAGLPVRMVGTVQDVTRRKRVEQERERLITELQGALARVKTLSGMLPICASCKKIRDDRGYWQQLEEYLTEHSQAEFSHGVCPPCAKTLYPDMYRQLFPELSEADFVEPLEHPRLRRPEAG